MDYEICLRLAVNDKVAKLVESARKNDSFFPVTGNVCGVEVVAFRDGITVPDVNGIVRGHMAKLAKKSKD